MATPSEEQAEVPKKGCFFAEHVLATSGNSKTSGLIWGSQRQSGRQAGRQTACSGWYRQNISVLSSCLICILAKSCLAVDEAEVAGWICKSISWAWLLPLRPAGIAQEGSRGLGDTSLAARSHVEELVLQAPPAAEWGSRCWSGLKICRMPCHDSAHYGMCEFEDLNPAYPLRSTSTTGMHALCRVPVGVSPGHHSTAGSG